MHSIKGLKSAWFFANMAVGLDLNYNSGPHSWFVYDVMKRHIWYRYDVTSGFSPNICLPNIDFGQHLKNSTFDCTPGHHRDQDQTTGHDIQVSSPQERVCSILQLESALSELAFTLNVITTLATVPPLLRMEMPPAHPCLGLIVEIRAFRNFASL